MTSPAETLLRRAGILPVVTIDTIEQGLHVCEALLEGGLTAIELTLRTPIAMQALAELKKKMPDVIIGAGTVLTPEQIKQSVNNGADFLVTPGTPASLIPALANAGIPAIPGAATASELLTLAAHGFHACKLFPATAIGGLSLIKSLAAPLADVVLCPTGGITEATAPEFLAQPNVACIGGSWMVAGSWLKAGEWNKVRDSAKAAAAIVRARGQ